MRPSLTDKGSLYARAVMGGVYLLPCIIMLVGVVVLLMRGDVLFAIPACIVALWFAARSFSWFTTKDVRGRLSNRGEQ